MNFRTELTVLLVKDILFYMSNLSFSQNICSNTPNVSFLVTHYHKPYKIIHLKTDCDTVVRVRLVTISYSSITLFIGYSAVVYPFFFLLNIEVSHLHSFRLLNKQIHITVVLRKLLPNTFIWSSYVIATRLLIKRGKPRFGNQPVNKTPNR